MCNLRQNFMIVDRFTQLAEHHRPISSIYVLHFLLRSLCLDFLLLHIFIISSDNTRKRSSRSKRRLVCFQDGGCDPMLKVQRRDLECNKNVLLKKAVDNPEVGIENSIVVTGSSFERPTRNEYAS